MSNKDRRVRNIVDEEVLIAQIYDFNGDGGVIFPTPDNLEMQCGFGQLSVNKSVPAHIHHNLKRAINQTSEFIFIMEGSMDVSFYNDNGQKITDAVLSGGMGMIQFIGGHSMEIKANTKYFEVKQGPYYGNLKEKTLI